METLLENHSHSSLWLSANLIHEADSVTPETFLTHLLVLMEVIVPGRPSRRWRGDTSGSVVILSHLAQCAGTCKCTVTALGSSLAKQDQSCSQNNIPESFHFAEIAINCYLCLFCFLSFYFSFSSLFAQHWLSECLPWARHCWRGTVGKKICKDLP